MAPTIQLTGMAGEAVEVSVEAFRGAHHGRAVLAYPNLEIIRPDWEEGPYTVVMYAEGIAPEPDDRWLNVRVTEWLDEIQAKIRATQQS